ncbi:hypothetical protein ACQPYK_19015 [Streptosporangium sp. CA-135522]|uniref:hypothetical protein n=1 Tax=Streptosporangium sp. CA-135522 TaxID=3240072 RepID=UPI003D8D8A4B
MSDYNNSRIFRLAFSVIIATAGVVATGAVVGASAATANAAGVVVVTASDDQPAPIPTPTPTLHPNGEPWGGR